MTRRVVVSGASGFLGTAICAELEGRGCEVRRLVRRPQAPREFACALPETLDASALDGADCLVHCAWDTRFQGAARAREVNVSGSRLVIDAARHAGARIVFVSTLSAHEEAESVYGRTKLEVEALLDLERDAVVRPGTVIGEGGVFWRQAESISRLPFIPLFYGGAQMYQTIGLADLATGVANLIENDRAGRYGLAEVKPVALRSVYQAVADAIGKPARFLQLPGAPVLAGLRIAESFGFRLPVSSDNLLGLKHLRAFDLAEDVRKLGLAPRTMRESLADLRWERLGRS